MPEKERLMTTEEVANLLGITAFMVRVYVRTNQLGAFKLGNGKNARYRISHSQVNVFLRRRESRPIAA